MFGTSPDEIRDITVLKQGMTNRSFLFTYGERKYIIRIPGEGTDKLINRAQEADVYRAINGKGICDHVVFIDPHRGYKITEYLRNARVCNPLDRGDVRRCMSRLRALHNMALCVGHETDLYGLIEFYESLRNGAESCYPDYSQTKEQVFSLKPFIERNIEKKVLTHIDAVPDNFLFYQDTDGKETICLIDWEYAGMQDPHVDIAMFCIYSLYRREQIDGLIRAYFPEGCPDRIRIKIYCYIAVGGLLWSNWCEYKRLLGVEFGEYAQGQYRFAREYCQIAKEEMKKRG